MPTPVFGIPCEGPRLVPFGTIRLPSDKLKNGHPAFRVTQRYWDLDSYWNDGRIHGALDCGNFYENDDILASADGTVQWANADTSGALGVSIDHGDGWVSQYYHLNSLKVHSGQSVTRGQLLGANGDTGFAQGRGAHVHFVILRNSVKLDPWPLLVQPDFVLPDTGTPQEDILPKRLKVLNPPQMVSVGPAKALRAKEPKFSAPPLFKPEDEGADATVGPYPFVGYTDEGDRYDLPDGASSKKWGAYKVNTNKTDPYAGYLTWFPAIYGTLTDVPH